MQDLGTAACRGVAGKRCSDITLYERAYCRELRCKRGNRPINVIEREPLTRSLRREQDRASPNVLA
jgi:hypothetical protein